MADDTFPRFRRAYTIASGRFVNCPLCHQRKARRACPALGQHICSVCCGTKRLVEIACPSDCPYLAAARDHASAQVVRRHKDEVASVVSFMRDLNDRQSHLFLLILTVLARHSSTSSRSPELAVGHYLTPELLSLLDEDVIQAVAALAATYETASRGLVYEHRPESLPAERLVNELKPRLAEAGQGGGSAFERDAAVVLRRVEAAARQPRTAALHNRRAFLDLVGRVIREGPESDREAGGPDATPRLIMPQ